MATTAPCLSLLLGEAFPYIIAIGSGMPKNHTIPSSAFTAYELARHRISSCKPLTLGERNLLNGIPGLGGDDGRVTACYIILWKLTLVDFTFLGAKIYRELLLQTCITFIFFIGKDTWYNKTIISILGNGRL